MNNPHLLSLAARYSLIEVPAMNKGQVIITEDNTIMASPEVIRELKKHSGYTNQDFIYEDFQKRLDNIKHVAEKYRSKIDWEKHEMRKKIDEMFDEVIDKKKNAVRPRLLQGHPQRAASFTELQAIRAANQQMQSPFMLAPTGILSV